MSTRGLVLDEFTRFAFADRCCISTVCAINYEEPTPDHWSRALASPSLGGGAAASSPLPPARPSSLRARLEASKLAGRSLAVGAAGPGSRGAAAARTLRSATATQRFVVDPAAAEAAPSQPSAAEEVDADDIAQLVLPPPPPAFPRVRRGEPLLPERSHDPTYYPGLVNDPEPEPELRRKWPGWANYAVGGAALFVAGLIARGVMSGPATWSAVIDVTPSGARVQIDGESVGGSGSPRTRAGLIVGDHVLLVEQDGYVSKREVFTLSEADRRVVVSLDRVKKPDTTPAAQPVAAEPIAQQHEPIAEPTAPTSATATLETSVPDTAGLSNSELAKRKRSEIRAARVAERYRARKTSAAEGGSRGQSGKYVAPGDEPAAGAAPSASGDTGTLKLNSVPWSEVYVDKKHVGHTPLHGIQLPAGRHTIELTNPDTGMRKTLQVQLRAGETITKVEKLGG